jgi:hypothetical protein
VSGVQALELEIEPPDLQGETKQALKLEMRLPELQKREANLRVQSMS